MSLKILQTEYEQGVGIVIATPHFYARNTSLQEFLTNRDKAYQFIHKEMDIEIPNILLGAEVAMFPRMDMAEEITSLCIEGTNAKLIEMPFGQ